MKKTVINMVSESDIFAQGHGVHTAYDEITTALESRDDAKVVRGGFGENIPADIVHMHTIGHKTWRKLLQKDAKKVVSAHVVPASLVGSIAGAKYWLPIARWYMRWYYNKADKVLAVSDMTKQALIDEVRVPEGSIEVLYNTVDMDRYTPLKNCRQDARLELGFSKTDKVVVGVGQIQPRKRIDTFIHMARQLPEVKFVWVGGIPFKHLGADYNQMQKMINSVPDNLIITDVIPHDDVVKYLHAADIFCLPATQENHPMCVLEAAGVGLPIVLRDIPEYDDTFKQDALRCSTDEEFTEAIASLVADKDVYESWVDKSKNIRGRFDVDSGAARLVQIYKSLL